MKILIAIMTLAVSVSATPNYGTNERESRISTNTAVTGVDGIMTFHRCLNAAGTGFESCGGGGAPSGAAGGDLSGTYPNPTISTISASVVVTGTVTASGFVGSGAGLTNLIAVATSISASSVTAGNLQAGVTITQAGVNLSTVTTALGTYLPLAGGNMTGQLTTSSTIAVQGNGFSVGSSTLVVNAGRVSIGTSSATTALTVYGVITSSTAIPAIACDAGTGVLSSESNNGSGEFVAGAAAASCTITFNTNNPWPKKPKCFCNDETAIVLVRAVTTVTTLKCDVPISFSADVIQYVCLGSP